MIAFDRASPRRLALLALLLLGLAAPASHAVTDIVTGEPLYFGATVGVHAFTGDEMQDAYGPLYGATFEMGGWTPAGLGWRLDAGLSLALGDPALPDPTWTVESSEMQTAVIPLSASVLYRLAGGGGRTFSPYAGLGLDCFLGLERTSVVISREPEGTFDWNDTRSRNAFGGHVLLGTSFPLTGQTSGLVEFRWTLGWDGSTVEQSFSEGEIAIGWLEVEKAVQRPDYNFTGWALGAGVTW